MAAPFSPNPVRIEGDVAYLQLAGGLETAIDVEDLSKVTHLRWCAMRWPTKNVPDRLIVRANVTYSPGRKGRRGSIYLHRVILGTPTGVEVDHINHDCLDNRRANIRECTRSENMRNVRPRPGRYRGVYPKSSRWTASVKVDGVNRWLGGFASPEEAARAYDAAARECHGEFAYLNFPEAA